MEAERDWQEMKRRREESLAMCIEKCKSEGAYEYEH